MASTVFSSLPAATWPEHRVLFPFRQFCRVCNSLESSLDLLFQGGHSRQRLWLNQADIAEVSCPLPKETGQATCARLGFQGSFWFGKPVLEESYLFWHPGEVINMLTTPTRKCEVSSSVAGPAELSWASPRRAKDAPKAVRDAQCGTEAPHFICASFV